MINDLEIGRRIKAFRENANLSQHDLYKKTGISTTQISAYENGKKTIGLQTIAKISVALNVSIDELYFGSVNLKLINASKNEGELIVNCIYALFEKDVISALLREEENHFVPMGLEYYYKIGFKEFVDILDDLVKKLNDYEKNKINYPDPDGFKNQILAAAANQINVRKGK